MHPWMLRKDQCFKLLNSRYKVHQNVSNVGTVIHEMGVFPLEDKRV